MSLKRNILSILFLTPFLIFAQEKSVLNNYNFSSPVKQVKLDNSLNEISGLTIASGKLFSHNDESADIYQIDSKTGKIIKSFSVGNPALKDDFEGITYGKDKFYLITSSGVIYSFAESKAKGNSEYKKVSTGLNKSNIEGLCYSESTNSLLVACKGNLGKNYKGKKVIFSFDLKSNEMGSKPLFVIDEKELNDKYGIQKFSPSGIEKNTRSGTFFILSSNEKAIIEISSKGKILAGIKLDSKKHNQPEGIAFTSDGTLLISDEGGKGSATLTSYGFKK